MMKFDEKYDHSLTGDFKTGQIHLKRPPRVHVPAEVEAERDLALSFTKSLTSDVFNDPVPWRSALAKRRPRR